MKKMMKSIANIYLNAFEVPSILYQLIYLIFIIILRYHFTDGENNSTDGTAR